MTLQSPAALTSPTQGAALSTDPRATPHHVAKALVKFYVLELRSVTFEQILQHRPAQIVRELAAVGAADWHDGVVANRATRLRSK